jgi:GNAT superfamily N-acetyltransferase
MRDPGIISPDPFRNRESALSLEWIHESPPRWDENKDAIVGGASEGIFDLTNYRAGDVIPGEWWRVEDSGSVVGFGWMDANWGDAEILLAVQAQARNRGVGRFILDQLDREAGKRGLNYLYNVIHPTHPDRDGIGKWLTGRGFERSHDDESLRRRVGAKI